MPSSPQPGRPSPTTRTSSTTFQLPSSPLTGQTPPTRSKPQRHFVGHGTSRIGPRNTSYGKNINKLAKLTPIDAGEDKETSKHHKRSLSGNATPTSSSPRPSHVKRNASALAVTQGSPRQQASAAMKKTHSSGQIQRPGSSKALSKQVKSDGRPGIVMKRSSSQGKVQQAAKSPKGPKHPSVRFDVGKEEEQDDGWTEDSASQSPSTTRDNTRSNTRNNSIALDTSKDENEPPDKLQEAQQRAALQHADAIEGGSSTITSRPPDADAITSRLLQRQPSNNLPPQTSNISAVANNHASPQSFDRNQDVSLTGTPSSHPVSRFINGDVSTTGTPIPDSHAPLTNRQQNDDSADYESTSRVAIKRPLTKSTQTLSPPNRPATSSTSTPSHSSPSNTHTATPSANLPSSRTQQKLWLQRASTTVEPNSIVPAILPRTGTGPAAALVGLGVPFAGAGGGHHGRGGSGGGGMMGATQGEDGGLDPRLRNLYETVEKQWRCVRRFRDPWGDGVGRVRRVRNEGGRNSREGKRTGGRGGGGKSGKGRVRRQEEELQVQGKRRPKVSFEGVTGSVEEERVEDGVETRGASFDGQGDGRDGVLGGERDEVQEICRRMWTLFDGQAD
ncbi:MAG: hypothetical protein M1820_001292 [Bogoriella megaspora]|nr:MAG: hypothetical protein M1820_001292 [Bogoriella megaspora]